MFVVVETSWIDASRSTLSPSARMKIVSASLPLFSSSTVSRLPDYTSKSIPKSWPVQQAAESTACSEGLRLPVVGGESLPHICSKLGASVRSAVMVTMSPTTSATLSSTSTSSTGSAVTASKTSHAAPDAPLAQQNSSSPGTQSRTTLYSLLIVFSTLLLIAILVMIWIGWRRRGVRLAAQHAQEPGQEAQEARIPLPAFQKPNTMQSRSSLAFDPLLATEKEYQPSAWNQSPPLPPLHDGSREDVSSTCAGKRPDAGLDRSRLVAPPPLPTLPPSPRPFTNSQAERLAVQSPGGADVEIERSSPVSPLSEEGSLRRGTP